MANRYDDNEAIPQAEPTRATVGGSWFGIFSAAAVGAVQVANMANNDFSLASVGMGVAATTGAYFLGEKIGEEATLRDVASAGQVACALGAAASAGCNWLNQKEGDEAPLLDDFGKKMLAGVTGIAAVKSQFELDAKPFDWISESASKILPQLDLNNPDEVKKEEEILGILGYLDYKPAV